MIASPQFPIFTRNSEWMNSATGFYLGLVACMS